MANSPLPYAETLDAILSVLPTNLQKPRVGFVCGSGLGGLVDSFREVQIIPYETLPGFAKSTGVCIITKPITIPAQAICQSLDTKVP